MIIFSVKGFISNLDFTHFLQNVEDENAKDLEQEKHLVSQPAIEVTTPSRLDELPERKQEDGEIKPVTPIVQVGTSQSRLEKCSYTIG